MLHKSFRLKKQQKGLENRQGLTLPKIAII